MTTDPKERGGEPEQVISVYEHLDIPRPFGVRMFEAAGSPKGMLPWWVIVAEAVKRAAGTLDTAGFLLDLLDEVRNAADPVARETKGVGELHNPGGFMYSRCKKFVKSRGGTLPPYRGGS